MNVLRALLLSAGVLLITAAPAGAGPVLTAVPSQPDLAQRYLIYSHGQVVEERGPNAKTRFGTYDCGCPASSAASVPKSSSETAPGDSRKRMFWRDDSREPRARTFSDL